LKQLILEEAVLQAEILLYHEDAKAQIIENQYYYFSRLCVFAVKEGFANTLLVFTQG
jgi:hypothetical protein